MELDKTRPRSKSHSVPGTGFGLKPQGQPKKVSQKSRWSEEDEVCARLVDTKRIWGILYLGKLHFRTEVSR